MYTIWQWVVIVIVALILLCLMGTILAFQIKIESPIVAKIITIIAINQNNINSPTNTQPIIEDITCILAHNSNQFI